MRAVLPALVGLLLLACGAGCGSKPIDQLPDTPAELIVFSIDGPAVSKRDGIKFTPEDGKGELLYGYPVLGKVVVADPEKRREVVAAVKEAIRNPPEHVAGCFVPRHVVRSVDGGRTVDFVICFECSQYETYRDGQHNGPRGGGPITRSAKATLDQLLTDAGVPLPEKGCE